MKKKIKPKFWLSAYEMPTGVAKEMFWLARNTDRHDTHGGQPGL